MHIRMLISSVVVRIALNSSLPCVLAITSSLLFRTDPPSIIAVYYSLSRLVVSSFSICFSFFIFISLNPSNIPLSFPVLQSLVLSNIPHLSVLPLCSFSRHFPFYMLNTNEHFTLILCIKIFESLTKVFLKTCYSADLKITIFQIFDQLNPI